MELSAAWLTEGLLYMRFANSLKLPFVFHCVILMKKLNEKHNPRFLNPSGSQGTATSLYTREAFLVSRKSSRPWREPRERIPLA